MVSPGLDKVAIFRELHHAVVPAVAVGHEDVAICRDRDPGRRIEGIGTIASNARLAKRHQHLALWTELEYLMSPRGALEGPRGGLRRHAEHHVVLVCVAGPNVALVIDGEAVRKREDALAEAGQKPAGLVELQDRRVAVATDACCRASRHVVEASMEHPDIAFAIDLHPDQLSPLPSVHALR